MTATEVRCSLCNALKRELVQSVAVEQLVEAWRRDFGMDIRALLANVSSIPLYRCCGCGLESFEPSSLAGGPELYAELAKRDLYYIANKWEHERALVDIRGFSRGLEIGCGFGDFVERALQLGADFAGCEQNPAAIARARSRGVPIQEATIESLAATQNGTYDVVCAFQVLEHVPAPGSFLASCAKLLRPGGRLLLGLPNARSFLAHQFNLLDMPPHHMTRWRAEVLERLPCWWPFELERVEYEPLPDYQLDGYLKSYAGFFAERSHVRWFRSERLFRRVKRWTQRSGLNRVLKGQTLYACYRRT